MDASIFFLNEMKVREGMERKENFAGEMKKKREHQGGGIGLGFGSWYNKVRSDIGKVNFFL